LVVIAKSAQVVIAAGQILGHLKDIASSSQRRGLGSGSAVSLSLEHAGESPEQRSSDLPIICVTRAGAINPTPGWVRACVAEARLSACFSFAFNLLRIVRSNAVKRLVACRIGAAQEISYLNAVTLVAFVGSAPKPSCILFIILALQGSPSHPVPATPTVTTGQEVRAWFLKRAANMSNI
jgi:hypothetical protein